MGEYIDDAALFLRHASGLIRKGMVRGDTVQAMMNVGLGMERVLKEVLWRVNPTFVLINPVFKNAMPVLYGDKIICGSKASDELASSPDGDVLSFRNSLTRACVCSSAVAQNKSLLFAISNYRDVIAHNRLALLDFDKVNLLLQRDFFPLTKGLADELGYSTNKIFANQDVKLADLAATLEVDVEKVLDRKILGHAARWEMLKGSAGYVQDKDRVTDEVLRSPNKVAIKCPACGNRSVIYGIAEYDYNAFERREVCVGIRVSKLKCQYCKLEIDDYKLIDHLGLGGAFSCISTDDDRGAEA